MQLYIPTIGDIITVGADSDVRIDSSYNIPAMAFFLDADVEELQQMERAARANNKNRGFKASVTIPSGTQLQLRGFQTFAQSKDREFVRFQVLHSNKKLGKIFFYAKPQDVSSIIVGGIQQNSVEDNNLKTILSRINGLKNVARHSARSVQQTIVSIHANIQTSLSREDISQEQANHALALLEIEKAKDWNAAADKHSLAVVKNTVKYLREVTQSTNNANGYRNTENNINYYIGRIDALFTNLEGRHEERFKTLLFPIKDQLLSRKGRVSMKFIHLLQ
jgi:hypothetical protein